MRIKQSALLLAAVLSLGVAAVPAAATQNGGSAPKEPVWEIPLDVQDAQGISPLDPAVNYYANIPEETYELAQEVAHFDGFATVNTFEWSDEDQTLKIHFHDGEDKLADFVDSLETKARAELVQDKYSSAELQAAADRIMRKGKLSTGEHISYISPKPDGSGIEVGIDMPADRIPERAAHQSRTRCHGALNYRSRSDAPSSQPPSRLCALLGGCGHGHGPRDTWFH